jgi:hypothetical protein
MNTMDAEIQRAVGPACEHEVMRQIGHLHGTSILA